MVVPATGELVDPPDGPARMAQVLEMESPRRKEKTRLGPHH
jgi:hypothetical protein